MNKLIEIGAVKFGEFTLKSGKKSNIYFDCRIIPSHPKIMGEVVSGLCNKLYGTDLICGVPTGGLPFASVISFQREIPLIYTREKKPYGTGKQIEGKYTEGQTVTIIDDVLTTGDSVYNAAKILEDHGLKVLQTLVVVDRTNNENVHSLFKEKDFV